MSLDTLPRTRWDVDAGVPPRAAGSTLHRGPADTVDARLPGGPTLIHQLLSSSVILAEDWAQLPAPARDELVRCTDRACALRLLTRHGLLTQFQAGRVEEGTGDGLVLGNYRLLDRLGAGAMGVVFKAEHVELRRTVAVKVLSPAAGHDPKALSRFTAEMRAVAGLRHPNIVAVTDAGRCPGADPDRTPLRYFVMEFVPGQDLQEYVTGRGPLSAVQACDLIRQVAAALAVANSHGLVHRDIKPSNVRVTPEGQAKLLDFGLARHIDRRVTQPGTVLGTVDFMAPEQAADSSAVDVRADIYALGGTLFWCLTGRRPFRAGADAIEGVARRASEPPPSARAVRPDVPAALDAVLARMMAGHAADRYATPEDVLRALAPFTTTGARAERGGASESVADWLTRQMWAVNGARAAGDEPEVNGVARDGELTEAREALIAALTEVVRLSDAETVAHLERMRRYARRLAVAAAASPRFAGEVAADFIEAVAAGAWLHDIGNASLPGDVLNKPGPLTAEERILMQAHTTLGAETLQRVARASGFARSVLHTATDIVRHHHERYDGTGYPDRLAGEAIPLAARIVAVADAYDALRSRRPYKPWLSHDSAVRAMAAEGGRQFDPDLLALFRQCAADFDRVFHEVPDPR